MMRNLRLSLACILFLCSSIATAQEHSWGVGFRVGAFNQRNTFNRKVNLSDNNSNINSGFYYQAFVNKEIGKKKNWMIEANLGYNSFSNESLQYFPSTQPLDIFEYEHSHTNVFSLQFNLRYAFWNIPELQWKHYAGISVAAHENIKNAYVIGNTHSSDPTIIERGEYSNKVYHNFIGVEYFGKISLEKRLSIQYLFGYNFSTQILTLTGKNDNSNYVVTYDGPAIQRFNINFGIGYQL